MSASLNMTLSSVGCMVAAMLLSYFDNRLFPSQMMLHHTAKGFPGVANGSLWGNMILMSFAFYRIGSYWSQWGTWSKTIALAVGIIAACYAFLCIYRTGLHDDAWAGADQIHPAGVVAMLYTAGLLAAFILFYVWSDVSETDVLIIAALLLLYLPPANHVVLNFLNEKYHFIWCPRIFAEETRPLTAMAYGMNFVILLTFVKLCFPKAWL